jgi:hypothetical protein
MKRRVAVEPNVVRLSICAVAAISALTAKETLKVDTKQLGRK